jgi:hypothetical protein
MAIVLRSAGFLQLGTVAVRGERNTLAVSQDSLNRLTYNPFYAYMAARIESGIATSPTR